VWKMPETPQNARKIKALNGRIKAAARFQKGTKKGFRMIENLYYTKRAGDEIRTHDIHLGKVAPQHFFRL